MIPKNITEQHVLEAIQDIDVNGIKYPLTKSRKYDLLFRDKTYPPKLTISLANQFANGEYLSHLAFSTNEAQNYLKKVSPNFIIKEKETDIVEELIKKYKNHIRNNRLEGEIYKWELLSKFKGKPNVNAGDFFNEIKSVDYANLIYPVGITVIHIIAKDRTEPYRNCFKVLFDEDKSLLDRLKFFNDETLKIYRELESNEKFSHHQDERTMATFLTYHNPDKYTFYKDSFYQKYCKLIGVDAKKKGEKYVHYLDLLEDFINEYIKEDKELIDLVNEILPPNYFQDTNHKILAQDILYQTLDKMAQTNEVVALMASDRTGWQDLYIEGVKNADACIIWNSKRPSGTEETLNFLRKRVEDNNTFNLYYSAGGLVNYKATVIDFAENQQELDKKEWDKVHKNIKYYENNFSDYKDDNKSASIVFLTKSLEKINPKPVAEFKFYKGYDAPRQDNLSPIKYEPETIAVELNTFNTNTTGSMNFKNSPLNQILFGPPGTGKTYNSIDKAVEIATGKASLIHAENKIVFDELRTKGQIEFVTFHQNYSYEDFMVGIKPDITSGTLRFDKREGVFKQLADKAKQNWLATRSTKEISIDFNTVFNRFFSQLIEEEVKEVSIPMRGKGYKFRVTSIDIDNGRMKFTKQSGGTGHDLLVRNLKAIYEGTLDYGDEGLGVYYYPLVERLKEFAKTLKPQKLADEHLINFVLIIDEINRANISKVFGELITLLEDDKRLGAENELKITLPNGDKELFGVPPNLYIIGTMNTADKSIALVDIALRRRFEFIGYYPTDEVLIRLVKEGSISSEKAELLKQLNKELYKKRNFSADYLIGHAYFMNDKPIDEILRSKVIPLLMEYFSGKTKQVSEVFANSTWKAEYQEENYRWNISPN